MAPPARLPDEAPDHLRAFVACSTMSVELDLTELSWIPAPAGSPVDFAPAVEVLPLWTPTTATVRVGYGPNRLIGFELPIAIVGGRLSVDTARLPGDVERPITRWVTRFNETMADNAKQLDELRLTGSTLSVTKRPVAPAANAASMIAAPMAAVPTPRQTERPNQHGARRTGRRTGTIAALVVAALAVGGLTWGLATRGDDQPQSSTATGTAATTTTPGPTTSTTTAPSDATARPGAVADPDPDEPPPADDGVVCGELEGEALRLRGLAACDRAPTDEYATCTGLSECSVGRSPPFVAFGRPSGTDHSRSVADADTGESGASTQLFGLVVVPAGGIDGWSAGVRSDCSGTILTGSNPLTAAVTVVEQPLRSFGPCRVIETSITDGTNTYQFPSAVWGDDGNYLVDDAEPQSGDPDGLDDLTVLAEGFDLSDTWADAAFTVQNALARGSASETCQWFVRTQDQELVNTPDASCGGAGRWIFAAAQHTGPVDTADVLAVGAGSLRGSAPELDPFGWTTEYAFPCGPGYIGYTVCPSKDPESPTSPMVMVQVVFDGAVPLAGDRDRSVAIDFGESGGTEWTASYTDGTWRLERADAASTAARAILRFNSVTFVVPQSELPTRQEPGRRLALSTTIDGVTTRQPSIDVYGGLALPYDPELDGSLDPDRVAEPIDEFYELLSASVAAGDLGFSFDRLHPAVFDAFSESACREALTSFADPDLVIDFIGEGATEPWVWEVPDGASYEVGLATTVTISLTGRGQTGEPTESHVVDIDGRLHWFTFCT